MPKIFLSNKCANIDVFGILIIDHISIRYAYVVRGSMSVDDSMFRVYSSFSIIQNIEKCFLEADVDEKLNALNSQHNENAYQRMRNTNQSSSSKLTTNDVDVVVVDDDDNDDNDSDAVVPDIDPTPPFHHTFSNLNALLFSYMQNIETVRRRLIEHRRRQQQLLFVSHLNRNYFLDQ